MLISHLLSPFLWTTQYFPIPLSSKAQFNLDQETLGGQGLRIFVCPSFHSRNIALAYALMAPCEGRQEMMVWPAPV
jgi:hypothetical protein